MNLTWKFPWDLEDLSDMPAFRWGLVLVLLGLLVAAIVLLAVRAPANAKAARGAEKARGADKARVCASVA